MKKTRVKIFEGRWDHKKGNDNKIFNYSLLDVLKVCFDFFIDAFSY